MHITVGLIIIIGTIGRSQCGCIVVYSSGMLCGFTFLSFILGEMTGLETFGVRELVMLLLIRINISFGIAAVVGCGFVIRIINFA
jgi:hypothetical protein